MGNGGGTNADRCIVFSVAVLWHEGTTAMKLFTAICLLVCLSVRDGFGADWWIAQNATGSGSGADTNNCMAITTANSSWPASAGDTVHLCGVLTNGLVVGAGGTVGNPLVVHFEPNAKFSALTSPLEGAWINVNYSYTIIDGGQNGLIENTSNGTTSTYGGTMLYGNNANGIGGNPGNNITIQNLSIRGMYNRQTNTEPQHGGGLGSDIFFYSKISSLVVSNCVLGESQNTLSLIYDSVLASNLTVTACLLTNYNHGITLGCGGGISNPLFNNVFITHNKFLGGDMFETADGIGDLGFHRNPIFIFNESDNKNSMTIGGCISNVLIAYNFISHGSHPLSSVAGSGAMFFDISPWAITHVRVYNNISTLAWPLNWSGGGGLIAGSGMDVLVANNTAIASHSGSSYQGGQVSIGGTNAYCYNNIVVSASGIWLSANVDTTGMPGDQNMYPYLSSVHSDYNIFNQQQGNSFYELVYTTVDGSRFQYQLKDTFAQWTNSMRWFDTDFNSKTATVQLDANFIPLSTDTVAIGNGTNLTAWGITDDYAGNPRPATGAWTIGAYQKTAPLPAPLVALTGSPTNIIVGVPNVAQSSTLTWLSVNASSVTLSGMGQVPLNGSINVSPSQTTTYTATATNPNGTNSASVTITAAPAPPGPAIQQ